MNLQEFLNTGFSNGCVSYKLEIHRTPHGVTKFSIASTGCLDIECDGVVDGNNLVIFENPRIE